MHTIYSRRVTNTDCKVDPQAAIEFVLCSPVKNGSSENHMVGKMMFLTPFLTKAIAGVSKARSKQVNNPNVTLKSVVKVDMSGTSVVFLSNSPNKLNLRYLKNVV